MLAKEKSLKSTEFEFWFEISHFNGQVGSQGTYLGVYRR